jgi:hypothetical protein
MWKTRQYVIKFLNNCLRFIKIIKSRKRIEVINNIFFWRKKILVRKKVIKSRDIWILLKRLKSSKIR